MQDLPSFARNRERRLRRRRIMLAVAYVLVGAIAFSAAFFGTMAWRLITGITRDQGEPGDPADVMTPPRIEVQPDEPLNILVLGTDAGLREDGRRGPKRSDTMMLFSYDPLTDDVSVLSIPRDTRVEIPVDRLEPGVRKYIRENPTKITHAHAYGGPAVSMAAVSALLDVPVHRYVRVNLEGFVNLVDLLGGIDICVPKDMFYRDPYQDLYINLKKGCQRLDGEKALQYARYRQDSDLARIARQHEVIQAMIERALRIGVVPRLGQLVDEVVRQVDTNLTEGEILHLVGVATRLAANYDPSRLVMKTIPGRDGWINGVYYWIADEAGTRELVDALIWRLAPPPDTVVHVVVRDASGTLEAGEQVAESLAQHGFQVVEVVEDEPADHTTVIIHQGDEVVGKVIARAIMNNIKTARVYKEPDAAAAADITIVVGRDYVQNHVQSHVPNQR